MEVLVRDQQSQKRVRPAKVRQMAEKILSGLGCHDKELSVLLVDDEEIADLNRHYRSREGSTNVLAFAMGEGEGAAVHAYILGDIVISTETAVREAQERSVTLEEEMVLLLTHGMLHLLGYEDEGAPHEALRMEEKEREVLKGLGFSHPGWSQPPF